MSYTPREVAGWTFLAQRRRARELAEILSIGALAARGEPREVKKRIKELTKDRGPD